MVAPHPADACPVGRSITTTRRSWPSGLVRVTFVVWFASNLRHGG
jgi:hypothetical protein